MNPLFADDEDKARRERSYILPPNRMRRIERDGTRSNTYVNPAAAFIRRKIDALYEDEPNARRELAEAEAARHRSKHQTFMHQLSNSGRPLAEIQQAWHAYYQALSDTEKREVWQEFYTANQQTQHNKQTHTQVVTQATPTQPTTHTNTPYNTNALAPMPPRHRSVAAIKKRVLKQVRERSATELKAKQHIQSLAVGLGLGALVLFITLFGLFNEIVIAPFIRPTSTANATPIILSTDGVAPNATPEVIVPKINVQLPVIYGSQSIKEEDVQNLLNDGIFHYPTTALPGQQGNAAYFGHSSNNILNKGRYKFAFVLLHELEPGDIFYLTKDKKVYTYRVYEKRVVEPSDTWVLNPVAGKSATATLITCDPPGTSLHRLVVWGEQISPDPTGNATAPTPSASLQSTPLPGNGPSAWSKLITLINPFD
ncbi:MAG TPA: class D sortase [Candidatus Saccharimonadales bacterium]|nr:class D sortase [Candidatus Saccharimonadales bacterium]